MSKFSFKQEPSKNSYILNALGGAVMTGTGALYGISELGLVLGIIWIALFGIYTVVQIVGLIKLLKNGEE